MYVRCACEAAKPPKEEESGPFARLKLRWRKVYMRILPLRPGLILFLFDRIKSLCPLR